MTSSQSTKHMALEGIRVLDLTWGGAGPFATKALADHGADVIKVETSTHYDFPRTTGPYAEGKKGINRSTYFSNRNTSKRGITLNFKKPKAIELAKRLVRSCDLVVNNFRAGVMERMGLGYQDLAAIRPDLIYVSMPLQGSAGPQFAYSGVGQSLNVLAAINYLTGYAGGPSVGPGTHFPDHSVNPGHALTAILAALIHRKRTGRGQYIEVSQLESTLNLLGPDILAYNLNGVDAAPQGNNKPLFAPYGAFPCKDQRWIAISVGNDAAWKALCGVAAGLLPESDLRFATQALRCSNRDAVNAAVAAWTRQQDAFALMEWLQARHVIAGLVQNAQDLLEHDPQLAAREHFVELDHPEMGRTIYNGIPYRLSRTPGRLRTPAPLLGQHNAEILGELLQLNSADIASLSSEEVLK